MSGGSLTWTGLDQTTVTAAGSTDPLSGVAGYEHRTSTDGGSSWSAVAPGAAVTVTAQGETLVQFRATDTAGNAGPWVPTHGGSPDPLATVRLAGLGLGPQRRLSATGTPGDPSMDATPRWPTTASPTSTWWCGAPTPARREVEVWGRPGHRWRRMGGRLPHHHQGPDGDAAFVAWEPRWSTTPPATSSW
ncbi:MAG: hypothetical protein U0Y82_05110 [Thermoleophilia bacterium]